MTRTTYHGDQGTLQVLLLEDDVEARRVVRDALASGHEHAILHEADTLAECRRLLESHDFDLFLVDLALPDGTGTDAIRHACALKRAPVALVISSLADENVVIEAIMAGAKGYVSKLDPPGEIAHSIEVAVAGGSCMSPTIAQKLMELLRRQADTPAAQPHRIQLTERERDVLQLASRGYNYRRIAEISGTRPSTVYTHVRHIYEKLHVSNLAQALFEARRLHLV